MPALADRTQRKLIPFLLSAAFVAMLYLSWMRWGTLYVDTFRDQWFYHKIFSGKVVYRDFCYRYGFLPPYIGALFYRFFGETLYAAVAFGLVVTALCTFLIYRISRLFLDRFISVVVVLNFIVIFAFNAQGQIFNFILPYSSAMTVAMLFVLLVVYFTAKFIFSDKRYCLYLAGIFLYFVILSRFELGFLAALGLAACGAITLFVNRDRRLLLLTISAVLAGFLSYLIFIAVNHAYDGFYGSVCKIFIRAPKEHYFFIRLAGFLTPVRSVLYAFEHFSVQLLFASIFIFMALRIGAHRGAKITALLLLTGILPLMQITKFPYYGAYSSIPIIFIFGLVYIVGRFMGGKGGFKANLALFLLFFTAMMISLRVILNFSIFDYGFAFGALAIISFYVFWFKFFPGIFTGIPGGIYFYRLLFAVFFMLLNFPLFIDNVAYYKGKDIPVKSSRGLIFSLHDESSLCFWQAVDYLNNVAVPGKTMVVLPEGIGLNYFSNLDNPLRYETFIPPDLMDIGGDDKLIAMLLSNNIEYIAITGRVTREYGYSAFGLDYGRKVDSWVKAHYRLEKVFGRYPFTSPDFGIAVYRRNK
jgi:hypothetical protein